jgi:hypothetical protein
VIQQGLKNNQKSDTIIDNNLVLGTRQDLLDEYRWLLARAQRLAKLLDLPPLMTGKQARKQGEHDEPKYRTEPASIHAIIG